MNPVSPKSTRSLTLPERTPAIGELVQVRSRRRLVEEVISSGKPGQSAFIRLACADDDNQGQLAEVFWDYEPDRRILEEEGWGDLASKGFDPPRRFAAFIHTLRWSCVTATEPARIRDFYEVRVKRIEPVGLVYLWPETN